MTMQIKGIILLLLTSLLLLKGEAEVFHEELLLKILNSGHIYSYFQFTTLWNNNFETESFKHCHLVSLSLGELIRRYNIHEMHITLTEGFWHYKKWGYPVKDAAPGSEVLVWFKRDTVNVEQSWKDLVNALSGLLCASLNFINEASSISPTLSFRLKGIDNLNNPLNSSYVRYATLPHEIVCTENLTPWKKLLPCVSSGLITLLNARPIHYTDYHSLGIHFRPVCMNVACTSLGVELQQTVSLVHDLMIIHGNNKDWSIRKLFGSGVKGACPVAQASNIYLDLFSNYTGLMYLSDVPHKVIKNSHKNTISRYGLYNLTRLPDQMFSFDVIHQANSVASDINPPILTANRYIAGYGHEFGKMITKVHNNYHEPLKIIYLENIPWFTPIYYQSLRVTSGSKTIMPIKSYYLPGESRLRPYYLEVLLELSANSVTEISLDFEYIYLKWQEYPPDANHGFYIGSAIITALLPKHRNYTVPPFVLDNMYRSFNVTNDDTFLVQIRTETVLVTLPTPDFSMPYNVICLACTVVALAFGPIHNITTKTLCYADSNKTRGLRKLISSVKSFIINRYQKSK